MRFKYNIIGGEPSEGLYTLAGFNDLTEAKEYMETKSFEGAEYYFITIESYKYNEEREIIETKIHGSKEHRPT